jgi:ATP-dependent Clp protease ATP-binding subunit ClpC
MQGKYTRAASNALALAKKAAQSCKHSYIGTEHILLGLRREKEGTAGKVLEEFHVEE